MPVLAAISGAAGGGRFTADKPTLIYSTTGQFQISNYNSSYIYTFSNPSAYLSGDKVILPSADSLTNVYARTPKGVSLSSAGYCERKARSSYWTVTQASHCDCCGSPCGGCCGPGTFHSCVCDVGGGCRAMYLACCECGYWTEYNFSSSGYTFNSNGNEWYKIS